MAHPRPKTIPLHEFTENQIERFWSNMIILGPDDCWEWQLFRMSGYGRVEINTLNYSCSRMAFTLTYGPIPGGLICMHTCDNPPCCNPEHLAIGTTKDNMDDRDRKQRRTPARGSSSGNAKLTEVDALNIYWRITVGKESSVSVSKDYPVSASTVRKIKMGMCWSHVTGAEKRIVLRKTKFTHPAHYAGQ